MNHLEAESCPICWRTYTSSETIPVCLPCGHSFCQDCASSIRSCSLCRHRLGANYQRRVNFALVGLLEKIEAVQRRENGRDQQIQTEDQIQMPTQSFSTSNRENANIISFFPKKIAICAFIAIGEHLKNL